MSLRLLAISLTCLTFSALPMNSALAQESYHFKKKGPTVGTKRVSKEGMDMTNEFAVGANGQVIQTVKQKLKAKKHFVFTVLATKDETVTKLKVHVKAHSETLDQGPMGVNSKKNPLVGKTFIIEQIDDVVAVTDGDGNPVDEALVKEARKEFGKEVGKKEDTDFDDIIPDRPLKIGETLKVPPALAKKMFDAEEDGTKIEQFSIKFVAVETKNGVKLGVFEMVMNMSVKPAAALTMTVKMKGKMRLGIENSWPYEMSLKGPLVFKGSQQGMDLDGKGTMSLSNSAQYTVPQTAKTPKKSKKPKLY